MSNWKLGPDSYHKLIAWFADGNIRTFYSIDWISRYSRERHAELGLERLHKRIAAWGTRALVVEIYENNYGTRNGKRVERYELGTKIILKK